MIINFIVFVLSVFFLNAMKMFSSFSCVLDLLSSLSHHTFHYLLTLHRLNDHCFKLIEKRPTNSLIMKFPLVAVGKCASLPVLVYTVVKHTDGNNNQKRLLLSKRETDAALHAQVIPANCARLLTTNLLVFMVFLSVFYVNGLQCLIKLHPVIH